MTKHNDPHAHTLNRAAFTLVELLVVIAIIGLLSTIAVTSLNSSKVNARNTARKANMMQVTKALELYYSDFGKYPDTSGVMYGNCTGAYGRPDVDTLNAIPSSCNDILTPSWIPGLVSCGYMIKLPRDPNTEKGTNKQLRGFLSTSQWASLMEAHCILGIPYVWRDDNDRFNPKIFCANDFLRGTPPNDDE